MGFFEKFTKPNPETQKLIDAEKARIQGEGAAVSSRMTQEFAGRRAAIHDEHAPVAAARDAQIAELQQGREAMRREGILNLTFGPLRASLLDALTRKATDRTTMNEMVTETDGKLQDLRTNPDVSLSDVEAWAVSKVGEDENLKGRVKQAFATFKAEMESRGAILE